MGCANSKQKRCRHCQGPYSPVPKSYSMHVHHPPEKRGDSYHIVALTSTTLGSLKLDQSNQNGPVETKIIANGVGSLMNGNCHGEVVVDDDKEEEKKKDFSMGIIEAKTWSNVIQEKIPKVNPKTPIMTPPGEPETINTWELMEGLEDTSPFRSPNHFRSFSFNVARDPNTVSMDSPNSRFQHVNGTASVKPLWVQLSDEVSKSGSLIQEFDPEVISEFRKSLQELNPAHPFYIKPSDIERQPSLAGDGLSLDMNYDANKVNGVITDYKCAKEKEKVIVYFTSLRGVRRTYEDCCHVRVILKGLGVRVDERDVSMHSGFKDELRDLLGDGFSAGTLPRVFVGINYIGGAEEIRKMHEEGQLEKVVERCEMVDDGDGGANGACEACGDVRFVPCETCSGSCKIYHENDDEEEEAEVEGSDDGEFGFHRCPDCNENGLIRCPICCY
ncbi:hypothetical protein HS088_TW04G00968 [Tripterygium wilfordii]|uniref:Glutaredoxin domain-containing protein n=1 Tax=Tripterygium wilfordii TaxID=458696 RepID=A0A7J7DRS8_TRIWF|nr:uncharacterized protein At5g39865-like [Tripterygium wilfordii]KAF5749007.1 hypothetical protein HS088_TW04G00968 [Tripterygium wilfordii]